MKRLKTKLIYCISLSVLVISMLSGLLASPALAANPPKIYVTSGGVSQSDAAQVQVNVQISTLTGNSSPGSNAFAGDTIQQVGSDYFIYDSAGNKVDQIPSAINLAIIDVQTGNYMGTYGCGSGTAPGSNFLPCGGDYITPSDLNGNLTISANGTIPYSAWFAFSDENGALGNATNPYNFVGCPSGPNITISPACNKSPTAQKTWTVQSCTSNNNPNPFSSNNCTTTLQGASLSLPLPANYKAPTGLVTTTPTVAVGQSKPSCDGSGFSLSWIFCPVINGMVDGISSINTNLIQPELQVTPIVTSPPSTACTTNPNGPTCDPAHAYAIWSSFRLYGNIVLVIALLALVFGEIIGAGVVDAYTLKKMLPRILIAAILINLSIYIVATMIDISNVIGHGITYLISQPFVAAGANTIKFSDLSGLLGGVGVAGTIWGLAVLGTTVLPFLLLFILLPAFIAIIGVVLTILFRQALVILLVLSAPIAFALYCLPNTEIYFKKWWSLLFKTLLIFPIVEALFALSNALAVTISSTGGSNPITQILAVIALFVPLFLIPFAFKLAGGILGSVNGAINGAGKKLTEAIKGNPNDPNSLRNRSKRQMLERGTQYQGKFVEPGRKMGASGRQKALTRVADLFGNYDARISGYNEAAAKRREQITNFGNDDLVFAGGGYAVKAGEKRFGESSDPNNKDNINNTGQTEYYSSKGNQISKLMYTKGKSLYGGSQHDVTQALGYATYKSQTDKDFNAAQFAFNRNAEEGGWDQSQIIGNYLGATFPYKGRSVFHRYEVPQLDTNTRKVSSPSVLNDNKAGNDAYYGGIKQMHKSGEAFKLSSVSDKDWMSMFTKQRGLEQKLTSGTATPEDVRNLAMTYEIMNAASQKIRDPNYTEEATDEQGNTTVVAGGASPASQGIIEQAVRSRQYKLEVSNPANMEKELIPAGGQRADENNAHTFTTGPTVE